MKHRKRLGSLPLKGGFRYRKGRQDCRISVTKKGIFSYNVLENFFRNKYFNIKYDYHTFFWHKMTHKSPFRCSNVLFGPFRWLKFFSVFCRTPILLCLMCPVLQCDHSLGVLFIIISFGLLFLLMPFTGYDILYIYIMIFLSKVLNTYENVH